MSVPAVSVESMYRNPVEEVARFFNTKVPRKLVVAFVHLNVAARVALSHLQSLPRAQLPVRTGELSLASLLFVSVTTCRRQFNNQVVEFFLGDHNPAPLVCNTPRALMSAVPSACVCACDRRTF